MAKRVLLSLTEKQPDLYPYWFMRQAGRYLPEYRKIRERFPDFLSFCYTPDAACEVTIQPITRFDCDAAILFSDILVIPDALGQEVRFMPGHGPKLTPLEHEASIRQLDSQRVIEHLQPVFVALRAIRRELSDDKALIGFAGAPWTVACYMIDGEGSKEFAATRQFAYRQPELFQVLIDTLVTATANYLCEQVTAGADMVQLFDSWAGLLPPDEFERWVIRPATRIVSTLKAQHPAVPIIGFARGAGDKLADYAARSGVDGVSIDTTMPLLSAAAMKQERQTMQGNLDPLLLASNRERVISQSEQMLSSMRGMPYIVNLGHGIVPHTPIENVHALCDTIRDIRGE